MYSSQSIQKSVLEYEFEYSITEILILKLILKLKLIFKSKLGHTLTQNFSFVFFFQCPLMSISMRVAGAAAQD